jgi:hypothetical protein
MKKQVKLITSIYIETEGWEGKVCSVVTSVEYHGIHMKTLGLLQKYTYKKGTLKVKTENASKIQH